MAEWPVISNDRRRFKVLRTQLRYLKELISIRAEYCITSPFKTFYMSFANLLGATVD